MDKLKLTRGISPILVGQKLMIDRVQITNLVFYSMNLTEFPLASFLKASKTPRRLALSSRVELPECRRLDKPDAQNSRADEEQR